MSRPLAVHFANGASIEFLNDAENVGIGRVWCGETLLRGAGYGMV